MVVTVIQVAAAKGLMAGNVTICNEDGSLLDPGKTGEVCLIPHLLGSVSVNMDLITFILVIEKEVCLTRYRKGYAHKYRQRIRQLWPRTLGNC